jgi:hypothetical protein
MCASISCSHESNRHEQAECVLRRMSLELSNMIVANRAVPVGNPEILGLFSRKSRVLKEKKKANRGPRRTQGGLRPQHPRRDERRGATPSNTGRGQREGAQATVHQTSSKHTLTNRHGRISNRSSNQKDIAGKNRAHQQKQSGDKRTRSRKKDTGATACKCGRHPQGQNSQHAGALARPRQQHKTRDIRDQATNL